MKTIEVPVVDEAAAFFASLSQEEQAKVLGKARRILEDQTFLARLLEIRQNVQSRITEEEAEEIMREILAED